MFIVGEHMDELRVKYRDLPKVGEYLTAVHKNILEDIEAFKSPVLPSRGETGAQPPWLQELPSRKYQVNLLVDNSELTGGPVVVETNPSYNNLFRRVEKESHFGTLYTDFTMIRAGAIHRANGGYLVLSVEEVLQSPLLLGWSETRLGQPENRVRRTSRAAGVHGQQEPADTTDSAGFKSDTGWSSLGLLPSPGL